MTQQELVVEQFDKMIADLDKEFNKLFENQEEIKGSKNEVYQQVGKRMLAEAQFSQRRSELVNLRNEAMGTSVGVEAFLKSKPELSKFDVDEGKCEEDKSLTPLGGKQLI